MAGYTIKGFKSSIEVITLDELSKVTVRSVSITDRTFEDTKTNEELRAILINTLCVEESKQALLRGFIKAVISSGMEEINFDLLKYLNLDKTHRDYEELNKLYGAFDAYRNVLIPTCSVLVSDPYSIDSMDTITCKYSLNAEGYYKLSIKSVKKMEKRKMNWSDDAGVPVSKDIPTTPTTSPTREVNF